MQYNVCARLYCLMVVNDPFANVYLIFFITKRECMKKRVILFDQDNLYGSIMDNYLSSTEAFVYLGWYQKMEELVPILKANRPDYLLIEIPETADLSLIEEVKRNCTLTDVIILSSKDDRVSIFK